ncbi:pilus assembly PilX N-terminal domain-containing protein [uncultured Desulfosarcina sp.]|uniref:pilus assembly PilX family protein n=1 Tax=uncultured Desulfosarcina sp. TaxID=218289 RepID=UPI0029C80604|nr:pilus assembly PilX N-terminal domain-containing protein [uncultured Desulfosarcina sp.]
MEKHIRALSSPLNNENGSAIIAAIFILVVVTVLGITATNTSTLELQIASNDQFIKMAFYNSDSAVWGTSKLISLAVNRSEKIDAGTGNDAPGIAYLPADVSTSDEAFYRQIAGYDVYVSDLDIDFTPGGINAQADARRVRQVHMEGGGAEFATGAEGVGPSAIAIYYDVNTGGFSNRQTTSNLTASYRKMVGIPGGL